jgi:hypothetical protein
MARLMPYASRLVAWFAALALLVFGYGIFNAVAWNIEVGDDLAVSRWGAVYQRVMYVTWLEPEHEDLLLDMSSAKNTMIDPGASAAEREAAREQYEAAQQSVRGFLVKMANGVIFSCLVLVELPIEVTHHWRKRRNPPVSRSGLA